MVQRDRTAEQRRATTFERPGTVPPGLAGPARWGEAEGSKEQGVAGETPRGEMATEGG